MPRIDSDFQNSRVDRFGNSTHLILMAALVYKRSIVDQLAISLCSSIAFRLFFLTNVDISSFPSPVRCGVTAISSTRRQVTSQSRWLATDRIR